MSALTENQRADMPKAKTSDKQKDGDKKKGDEEKKKGEGSGGGRNGGTTRVKKTRENAHKKATGAGGKKYEWKDPTNDGTTGLHGILRALDRGDPLYSSGGEDDNYVLVSGDAKPEAASVRFDRERAKLQIGPKYTLQEFKRQIDLAFDELYVSGEVEECVRSIIELGCPEFGFYVVKRGVSKAIDREARERELTSRALSLAVPAKLLTARDVAQGFERLFEAMDDLVLDAPSAPSIVGAFLVRCVVDEALPPSTLGDRVFVALGGEIVLRARRLLSREHAGAKLERIWGPGDGRDAADLKLVIDQILGEYAASRDLDEACRCVEELGARDFGHEVVKRAVTFALSRDDDLQIAVSDLFVALAADATSPLLSQKQATLGFKRLNDALYDLTLDVPNAPTLVAAFEQRARAANILEPTPS